MDLDLAIVGGGPSGIATALFLVAAAPHLKGRIAVLEKERYPREKICAGAIGGRADKLLARIGVRVDVPSVVVHGLSVATAGGTLCAHDAQAGPAGIGRVVRRFEFDRALADEARARGIDVVEGSRVTRVDVQPDRVRLHASDGEITARVIVGADGVGSVVRRALGAPRGRWMAQVVEVDTPARPEELPRDLLHFDVTDRSLYGYTWDFPTLVGGRALVCRGAYELRPERDASAEPAADERHVDVGARLLARLAHLGVASEGLKLKRFAERGLALHEPMAFPRALLVGEAAGIDPVLGEGIAQAIAYGAAAGPYLARCLADGDLSFRSWPHAFRRSRIGLDLGIRSRATPWVYGASRPVVERWVAGSADLAAAGMRYFAGEHVPRRKIVGAGVDLARTILSSARDRAVRATSSAWSGAGSRR